MRLSLYLAREGNSASKLADEVGVAVSTITRAASGETLPNRETRQRIVEKTGGEVTAADLFAEHEQRHNTTVANEAASQSTGQGDEMSRDAERAA